MDTWTKQYTRVIDQRSFRLPPTWIPRKPEPASGPEHGGMRSTYRDKAAN